MGLLVNLILLSNYVSYGEKNETKLQYFCHTIPLWFEKCFTYYIISSSPQHKEIDVLIIPISQMRTLRLWEIL